jgi:hypothetical protein
MINYKITSFDEELGRIIVLPEGYGSMVIDLYPDENNNYLTGEALDTYIRGFLTSLEWENDRKAAALAAQNSAAIQQLVEPVTDPAPAAVSDPDEYIRSLIYEVLRTENLIP